MIEVGLEGGLRKRDESGVNYDFDVREIMPTAVESDDHVIVGGVRSQPMNGDTEHVMRGPRWQILMLLLHL